MEEWIKWAMELQSIAQAGLAYTDGVYDRERYGSSQQEGRQ